MAEWEHLEVAPQNEREFTAVRVWANQTETVDVIIDTLEGGAYRLHTATWARRRDRGESEPLSPAPFADLVAEAITSTCDSAAATKAAA